MTRQHRITFTIPTLTSGGAERVLTTMANHWAATGNVITVITQAPLNETPFYVLSSEVNRVGMGSLTPARTPLHGIANNLSRIRKLRAVIRQSNPDVVISFLDHMNVVTLLATRGTGIPVIVSEHTDPNLAARHRAWDRLRAALYPRAAKIVVLSESSKQFFSPTLQDRICIIPNPIVVEPPSGAMHRNSRKRVAALGRFGPEKGFDKLISAFAKVAPTQPEWDLVIWGDGALRPDLEAQSTELGLADRISLPGRTSQPHMELRSADLYVLSSSREGFPMALAEAMACGLPAIAFDLPSGPRDIIRDGIDGVLVPNQDQSALAAAMSDLMSDDATRAKFALRAPEVLDRFGVDKVMSIWDELLSEVVVSR